MIIVWPTGQFSSSVLIPQTFVGSIIDWGNPTFVASVATIIALYMNNDDLFNYINLN